MKNETKEWHYVKYPDCKTWCVFADESIASRIPDETTARLMAAAPDLLAACKEALLAMRSEQELQASRGESVDVSIGISKGNLDRAIVKAEGRS